MSEIDLLKGAKGVAAAYPGVLTQWQVYKMVEEGQLPVIRKGRRLYFRRSDIEASFKSEIAA